MAGRRFSIVTMGALLTACNTIGGTSDENDIFKSKYEGSWTDTKFSPPTGADGVINASQGRLLFFAKKTCRFSTSSFESLMTEKVATDNANQEAGFIATTAAGLAVDGLASILTAAGQDRVEQTPISTSFNYTPSQTPICFELAKNSAKRGQYIMEFGFQHAPNGGAVRVIPSYLNYEQSSRSYLLNGGKRTVAVKFSFQALGAQNPSEYTINLGEYQAGDEVWFNASATSNENINLASPWILITEENKPIAVNLTATVIETTSGNKIAKLLGDELTENKQKVEDAAANFVDSEEPTLDDITQPLNVFDERWGSNFCRPTYNVFATLQSTGDYRSADLVPLQAALDGLLATQTSWPAGRDEVIYRAITLPKVDLDNDNDIESRKKRATAYINDLGNYCLSEYLEPGS